MRRSTRPLTIVLSATLAAALLLVATTKLFFHDFSSCQKAYFNDDARGSIIYCDSPLLLHAPFSHPRALAHEYLGAGYLELAQYDQAIDEETKALAIDPERWGAYSLRGQAHYDRGHYQQAVADFRQAISLRPQDETNYHNLALALLLRRNNYDAAIEALTQSIALNPKDPAEHDFRADIYRDKAFYGERDAYDLAIADYGQALQLNPIDEYAYVERARAYGVTGRFGHAIDDARAALKLRAAAPYPHSLLCRYLEVTKAAADSLGDCGDIVENPLLIPRPRAEDVTQGLKELEAKRPAEALKILLPAANSGNAEAALIIGGMYERGDGVKTDRKETMSWYLKAAATGDPVSEELVADAYHSGVIVPKDDIAALKFYRLAAEHGSGLAQSHLARIYHQGDGVQRDDVESVKWLYKDAVTGSTWGRIQLGQYYENGIGVPRSDVLAYMWYAVARRTSLDFRAAGTEIDRISKKLTEAEIEQAEDLAVKCWKSEYLDCDFESPTQ